MKVVLDISEPTFELCSQRLLNISFQVADVKYSLNRMDAVDLIKLITDEEKLKTLGFALCVGDWTTQPPAQLSRFRKFFAEKFEKFPEIAEVIDGSINKIVVCTRNPEKPNRNGHHNLNTYPGLLGWTQEYEDERLKSKNNSRIRNILSALKKFKIFADQTKEKYSEIGKNRAFLIDWVINYPNQTGIINTVIEFVEKIKKIEALEHEKWDIEVKILVNKLQNVSQKSKKSVFHRLSEFLTKFEG